MGIEKLDVSTVGSIMNGVVEPYGLTSQAEKHPKTVLVKNYKYPFYDGPWPAVFDHGDIEAYRCQVPATNP
jgi:hypothetical protein